ncbi:MAG TPA: hypothetical protein VMG36_06145 [Thermoplasmata archaeon]|nr:hypothetical protein [Thermoplasmata archaeon]
MRRRMVILGVVLLVIGAALWYLPTGTVSATSTMNGTIPYHALSIGLDAPFAFLGGTIRISVAWTSSETVSLSVYKCGTSPCSSATQYVAGGSGSSGSFSWSGQANVYYVVDRVPASGPAIQVTTHYTEPLLGGTVGIAITGFGVFVTVLGVWLMPPVVRRAPAPSSARATSEDALNDPRF